MALQSAMQKVQPLLAQLDALAAIGAWLARSERPPEPSVGAALEEVVTALGREPFDDLAPEEVRILRSSIQTFFRIAADLVENPDRPAGWSFDDPVVLQSMGQTSSAVVHALARLADAEADLEARLSRPAQFLDIGSGAGWISIEAARRWPELTVEGIDIFPPALELAAHNLAASRLGSRVSFSHRDVATLDEEDRYALAFLPTPFIPKAVILAALGRLRSALEPGGWLVLALFEAGPDPLAQALLRLRLARFGGQPWTPDELTAAVEQAGLALHGEMPVGPMVRLVIARRT